MHKNNQFELEIILSSQLNSTESIKGNPFMEHQGSHFKILKMGKMIGKVVGQSGSLLLSHKPSPQDLPGVIPEHYGIWTQNQNTPKKPCSQKNTQQGKASVIQSLATTWGSSRTGDTEPPTLCREPVEKLNPQR